MLLKINAVHVSLKHLQVDTRRKYISQDEIQERYSMKERLDVAVYVRLEEKSGQNKVDARKGDKEVVSVLEEWTRYYTIYLRVSESVVVSDRKSR